jgi:hypothetical protein
MPKYDVDHEPVKHALIKDGWTITDSLYVLSYKGTPSVNAETSVLPRGVRRVKSCFLFLVRYSMY